MVRHSLAPLLLCGCMADLRTDEGTVAHLGRLGRSPVTPEQALSVASQIRARNYVETAALVSYTEMLSLFSLAAVTSEQTGQQPTGHMINNLLGPVLSQTSCAQMSARCSAHLIWAPWAYPSRRMRWRVSR